MILKTASILSLLALTACMSSGGSQAPQKDDVYSDNPNLASPNAAPADYSDSEPQAPAAQAARAQGGGSDNSIVDAIKSGNDEAIYRASTAALAKDPNDVRALNALGMYHYKKLHFSAALLMFNKAVKLAPNLSDLHNNIGLVYLSQKEERDAIVEFKKAMEMNAQDGTAAANLGSIYIEQKDYTKALVAMEIAYRKNSRDAQILNNYGIALTANGKYPEANDIYKKGLNANANSKELMLNYAILLIDHMKAMGDGLDLLNKVKFLGVNNETRNRINVLENKAKAGLK